MVCVESFTSNDNWKLWFDSYDARSVGRGSSGTVLEIDNDLVIKTFIEDEEGTCDFKRERDIFQVLQKDSYSPYIVRFIEEYDSGLVLERLERTLRAHLRQWNSTTQARIQWIAECCLGLEYLHERGIMHGDIGCHNLLVARSGQVKLCDFAGSKREGEKARVCYEVRGQHPDYQSGEPTVATELFAIGSTIFEIWTSRQPYASESDNVVRSKYRSREFPSAVIKCPAVRTIVRKCWTNEYVAVAQVYKEVAQMAFKLNRLTIS